MYHSEYPWLRRLLGRAGTGRPQGFGCGCIRCPPGHGDIYPSLLGSGMLGRLVKAGIEYLFVSNSDNLGATLDLDLLAYFADSGKAFLMEARDPTPYAMSLLMGRLGCSGW